MLQRRRGAIYFLNLEACNAVPRTTAMQRGFDIQAYDSFQDSFIVYLICIIFDIGLVLDP